MPRKPQACDPRRFGLPAEAVEIVEPGGRGKPGRTKDAKHFRLPGGGSVAIFGRDLHYEAEPGVWEEVDTTVREAKAEHDKALVDRDGDQFDLCCVRASHKAYFRKNAKAPQRMEVPGGKGAITLDAIGIENVQAVVEGNKITYPGAWPGVDWVRTVAPWGVKSEFVLHGPEAQNEFRFRLRLKDLSWGQRPDGTVEFYRGSEHVASMRPPTVADAAGVEGHARQWIEPTAYGPELVVQVDRSWLEQPGRAWPVRLDPTVTIQPDPAAGKDAYVYTGYPDDNFNNENLSVGCITTTQYYYMSFLAFDVTSIPSSTQLTSATLSLYLNNCSDNVSRNFSVGRVGSAWTETGVTWNNKPVLESSTEVTAVVGIAAGWYSWVVTQIVQSWLNGTNNHGFYLAMPVLYDSSLRSFRSSDYTTPELRPKLIVVYNAAPNTPSNTSPGGTLTDPAIINTTIPRLSWTYSDPDGDPQAAYQVVITRDSDGVVVKDTGEVASSNAYYDVPAATLAAGVKYRWKVRVKDSAGAWSGYAAEVYIYTNRAPTATPTSPTGTQAAPAVISNSLTPTLQWSYSDADGHAQAAYQVLIKRVSDGATIKDTGEVASSSTSYAVPSGLLAWNALYYWQVRVKDAYGYWSGYTTAQYFKCNQTAGQPTNLSPAGTSTAPAVITTTTPTLSWTHTDPDSDPQSKYQVQVYRASDNALVKDTGEVASSTQSYAVPAGTLVQSQKYYWRVRTADSGTGLFGPWAANAYIYTNAAPYAPSGLNPPSGAVFDAAQAKVFSWTFGDPDAGAIGDSQRAYQLLIKRVSDGVIVYDSGKVVSGTSSHTLPGGTIPNEQQYQWQVRVWDQADVAGPYSSLVNIQTSAPPAVSILDPPDGGQYATGILRVQWSYSDPASNPQTKYRAILRDGGGSVVEDSGEVAGAATMHQFATALVNGQQYSAQVTVWDSYGLTASDTHTFTVSFSPPPTPTIGVVGEDAEGRIRITVTDPDPADPLAPRTVYNWLYRREGTGPWVRIAQVAKNGEYYDYAVASGTVYTYKAVAVSDWETTANSNEASVSVAWSKGLWLNLASDPGGTRVLIEYHQDQEESAEAQGEAMSFAGREYPVWEFSEHTRAEIASSVSITREQAAKLDALRKLHAARGPVIWRDPKGMKRFVVLPTLPLSHESWGWQGQLRGVVCDFSEAI